MLHQLTNATNFIALVMALWLGLYLVTRNPHRPETWLTGLALWSMGGYFLNTLLALNPPPAPPEQMRAWFYHVLLFWPRDVFEQGWKGWLQGWLPSYGIVFWYHATLLLLPGAFNRQRAAAALLAYLTVLAGILIKVRNSAAWTNMAGDPLYTISLSGLFFPLFAAGFIVFAGLSVRNLAVTARQSPKTMPAGQFRLFIYATLAGGATALLGVASGLLHVPVPQALPAFFLMVALLLAGIGIARYNALLSRKPLQRDFLYSLAETGAVLIIYLFFLELFHRVYPLPGITFVIVGCLAVITHHLIDLARLQLDRLFLRNRSRQLRLRLRGLLVPAQSLPPAEIIQTALAMVSREVSAAWAVILEFSQESVRPVVVVNLPDLEERALDGYPESSLHAEMLVILSQRQLAPPLEKAVLLVPLYQAEQTGVLLLGPSRSPAGYSEAEVEALREVGETIAALLGELHRGDGVVLRKSPVAWGEGERQSVLDGAVTFQAVELALRNMGNIAYLADSPLADLRLVHNRIAGTPGDRSTHLDCGGAVAAILEEAVTRLRPGEEEPANSPPRSWYPYLILRDAYLDGEPNREIMARLYISEGTFNRTRRAAIHTVARLIQEMEAAAG